MKTLKKCLVVCKVVWVFWFGDVFGFCNRFLLLGRIIYKCQEVTNKKNEKRYVQVSFVKVVFRASKSFEGEGEGGGVVGGVSVVTHSTK